MPEGVRRVQFDRKDMDKALAELGASNNARDEIAKVQERQLPPLRNNANSYEQSLKAKADIEQLVETHKPSADKSSAVVERTSPTPADKADGVKQAITITYPEGHSMREGSIKVGFDGVGQPIKFGDSYVKKDGAWHWKDEKGGLHKADFQGLSFDHATGQIYSQDRPNHTNLLNLDGTIGGITTVSDGSRVHTNSSKEVTMIERADEDRTTIKFSHEKVNGVDQVKTATVSKLQKDGKEERMVEQVSYHAEGADLVPDDKYPTFAKMKDFKVEKNGNIRYKTDNGEFIARTNGTVHETGAGKTEFAFDDLGRLTRRISSAAAFDKGANNFSDIRYKEGSISDVPIGMTVEAKALGEGVKRVSSFDEESGRMVCTEVGADGSRKNISVSQQPFHFDEQANETWQGEVGTGKDRKKVDFVLYEDRLERQTRAKRPDGLDAISLYDDKGQFIGARVEDKEGKALSSLTYKRTKDGPLQVFDADLVNNTKTTLTRDAQDRWTSDQPGADAVNALRIRQDGSLQFVDRDGPTHVRDFDHKEQITYSDKPRPTNVWKNADGTIARVGLDDKNYMEYIRPNRELDPRDPNRNPVDRIVQVVNGSQPKVIWTAPAGTHGTLNPKDGTVEHSGEKEGTVVVHNRDLSSTTFAQFDDDGRERRLITQRTWANGDLARYDYGEKMDQSDPERVSFSYRDPKDLKYYTRTLTRMPMEADAEALNPGQQRTRVQRYQMTKTVEARDPTTRPLPIDEYSPEQYFGVRVRPSGDVEATASTVSQNDGRRLIGERYVFHPESMREQRKFAEVIPEAARRAEAKAKFDSFFVDKLKPLRDAEIGQDPHDYARRLHKMYQTGERTPPKITRGRPVEATARQYEAALAIMTQRQADLAADGRREFGF